jgi:hypothetical protein
VRALPTIRRALPLVALLLCALAPARAAAAPVVNGDFESGTLNGWQVHVATEAGNWFAYRGTEAPIGSKLGNRTVQAPPQGNFAAVADEADPDTVILYQEVAVPAGVSSQLSLLAYYNSYVPIAVPMPDTLSVFEEVLEGRPNQQLRIDVMRAGAPIESLEPADVLLNVFATAPGSPEVMKPTKLTANLTPFAGQTVMLRIAVAAHQETLNAGIDEVQITSGAAAGSTGTGGSRGANGSKGPGGTTGSGGGAAGGLTLGKAKVDPRNGTVALPVEVPAAGVLRARGSKLRGKDAHGAAAIRATGAPSAGPRTVVLHLAASGAAWAILKRRGVLRTGVSVSFSPEGGGTSLTASGKVVLRRSRKIPQNASKSTD